MKKLVKDHDLIAAFINCRNADPKHFVSGEDVQKEISARTGVVINPSSVRGRFIKMGKPLRQQKVWGKIQPYKQGAPQMATTPKKTKYLDEQTLWVLKDVEKAGAGEAPGMSPDIAKFAGKRVSVAFTDNNGFIRIKENPNLLFSDKWFTDKPDITPLATRKVPEGDAQGYTFPKELVNLIPDRGQFADYVERPVDSVLKMHYALQKYPITQGKQGTGKTRGHAYYAMTEARPFLLLSCYEDFKLPKLFGDKTIQNGSIVFQESLFTRAIQHPCVVLFDEINAVSQANTFDFHALLQNRCLFIKDADGGNGKMYNLHKDCKIGFSQNPKSAKYIGGQVRASNFLGRCTYITYPEFSRKELAKALLMRYPDLPADEGKLFIDYYGAVCEAIEKSGLNVDISIRQLFNAVDFNIHGMDLEQALEGGITAIAEAVSNPKAKEALNDLSKAVWKERFEAGKAKP